MSPMRVLIAAGNYPQLSETYISTEIAYFLRCGIEVAVHAQAVFTGHALQQTFVFRGDLAEAIRKFAPDVLHSHYLHYTRERLAGIVDLQVPITVRSHSYDYSEGDVQYLQQEPRVKKIYAFPHFAREWERFSKVVPLPVAYNTSLYSWCSTKKRKTVLRMAAAKSTKGLDDFFSVAEMCPEYDFVLGLADMGQDPGFFQELAARRNKSGRVRMMQNVSWPKAQELTHYAGIYLDTSDAAGHRFGMPISIAESMATGCVILAKNAPGLVEYLGEAGRYIYWTPADAAKILKDIIQWGDRRWDSELQTSLREAVRFRDDVVLSKIVSDWESIV